MDCFLKRWKDDKINRSLKRWKDEWEHEWDDTNECCICEEDVEHRYPATFRPQYAFVKDEDDNVCEHTVCYSCLQCWVVAELSQGRSFVRCPGADCNLTIPHQLQRILAPELWKEVRRNLKNLPSANEIAGTAEYTSVTEETLDELEIRACPSCRTFMHRSGGCDVMRCLTCGTAFNWRTENTLDASSDSEHVSESSDDDVW